MQWAGFVWLKNMNSKQKGLKMKHITSKNILKKPNKFVRKANKENVIISVEGQSRYVLRLLNEDEKSLYSPKGSNKSAYDRDIIRHIGLRAFVREIKSFFPLAELTQIIICLSGEAKYTLYKLSEKESRGLTFDKVMSHSSADSDLNIKIAKGFKCLCAGFSVATHSVLVMLSLFAISLAISLGLSVSGEVFSNHVSLVSTFFLTNISAIYLSILGVNVVYRLLNSMFSAVESIMTNVIYDSTVNKKYKINPVDSEHPISSVNHNANTVKAVS